MNNDKNHRGLIGSTYESVAMPGGWKRNQVETIKMIDRFYHSQFKNGKYDSQGYRKFFYNIVAPACDIATKFIDLDTRDILLTPEHGNDELRVFLMQRRLKQWLKDTEFGVLLNEMTDYWPIYGHIVVKKSKDGWKLVPIQNIRNNPSAEGLVTDSFAEVYSLSLGEMEALNWDVDELREHGEDAEYLVYDIFDKTAKGWTRTVKGDLWTTKDPNRGTIKRAVESEINDNNATYKGSCTLFTENLKNHTYRELKWKHVPGSALGMGYVEYLEDNQIARNDTENLERKAMSVHSTPLFITDDEELHGKNVTTNYAPGHILKARNLTPVANEARNLPQFQSTRANWDQNTERKTFTSDITSGASLPSRTPLGVANLQASLATSFFERKREQLGLFLKALLLDDIIPSFVNDTAREHTLIFASADEESTYLDDMMTEILVGEKIQAYTQKTGWFPPKEEREYARTQVMDKLKGRKHREFKIPDNYWKNAKYLVDINITGESADVGVKSQLIQTAMQIYGTNPGIVQDPIGRQMLFKFLGLGGINAAELGFLNKAPEQSQVPPQVAGSLAKPSAPGMEMMQGAQQI
jgi:hypothetical protein